MTQSAQRDVIFTLKAIHDPGAKKSFDDWARMGEAAHQRIGRAHEVQVRRRSAAEERANRDSEKFQERLERSVQSFYRERERANERWRQSVAKAEEEAIRAQQRLGASVAANNRAMVEGAKQASEGLVKLARAGVLLGIANEEDLQKAMQMLATFQAAVDVFKGSIDLVQGGAKAYQAYRAAIDAATASQIALNAATLAGGGGRAAGGAIAGGVGAGIGGAVAGGVAGGVGAGAAGAVGSGVAAVGGAVGLGAVAVGLAAVVGGLALVSDDFREGLQELVGWTDRGGDAMKAVAEAAQERVSRFEQRRESQTLASQRRGIDRAVELRQEVESARARAGYVGPAADAAEREARLASARQTYQSAHSREEQSRDMGLAAEDALAMRGPALEEQKQALLEQKRILEEQRQVVLNMGTERLRSLETEAQKQQQLVDKLRSVEDSGAERFGQLSAEDQQATIAAFRRQQSGGDLSRADIDRLRAFLPEETRQMDIENAFRNGFSEIANVLQQNREKAEQRLVEVRAQIDTEISIAMRPSEQELREVVQEIARLEREALMQGIAERSLIASNQRSAQWASEKAEQ